MKYFITTTLFVFFSFNLFASENIQVKKIGKGHFAAKASASIDRSLVEVLGILASYEQSCSRDDCTYQLPSVHERKVFGDPNADDQFVVWTYVKDVKSAKYYSTITVERNNGVIHLKSTLPSIGKAKEYKIKWGEKHSPLFFFQNDSWKVQVVNGKTHVEYELESKSKDFFITRFPKKVLEGMKKSINAMIQNIKTGPLPDVVIQIEE